MRTVLIAPNAYKGGLDAEEAAQAIARGVARGAPEWRLDCCPLSDGGEGFVRALVTARGGTIARAATTDARGHAIEAAYGVLDGGRTVVVELSSAAGLAQLAPGDRDPLVTTTYGVGTLIDAAYRRHGFERLLLALGGSATVDGGAGLLSALGVRFLDAQGAPVPPGGAGLTSIARLDLTAVSPALEAEFVVAVDVTNPLLGPRGAAAVYGPQKGAGPAEVAELERALSHYADVLAAHCGRRVAELPGTGSAGGVPAGLLCLARARTEPGFAIVAEAVGLDARLAAADLVLTGEGRLDDQSFEGKATGRLAERCAARGVPLVALCGAVTPEGETALGKLGGAAFSLVRGPTSESEAIAAAPALLERSAAAVAQLVRASLAAPQRLC